jgi:hypothetical protein
MPARESVLASELALGSGQLGLRILAMQFAQQGLGLLSQMIEVGAFGQFARHDSSCEARRPLAGEEGVDARMN